MGSQNSFFGESAGYNTLSGNNAFFGQNAGFANTTGGSNNFFGQAAGESNTTGSNNCFFGRISGHNVTVGNNNCFFGPLTGEISTTGNDNSFFGSTSGYNNTSGQYNTAIGSGASTGQSLTNATALGFLASADANNKVRIGNTDVNSIGGQVNWTAFSDERVKDRVQENVAGLEFIMQLRPVTYHFNIALENKLMNIVDTTDWEGKHDIEQIPFSGFLAQEVEVAAKASGYEFSGLDKSGALMGLRYAEFTVPIVKAVQEQQHMIDTQKLEIAELKMEIEELKKLVQEMATLK